MAEPLEHVNLRTPGKRRAPQRHARTLAAAVGSYPSPNYSSRNGTKVTGVVIHTAEGPTDATNLGAYFAQAKVQASSHAGADDGKRVNYVDYVFEAWTLRNGNPWTDNLEMCGFAHWTRAEWLAHPGMLQQAATWVAERCHARNVPPKRLTPADIKAGRRSGYFAHWDYTQATGDGTHWDVGTGFPWDVFDGLVQNAYNGTPEDDMPLTPDDIEKVAQRTRQVIADGTLPYGLDTLRRKLDALYTQVTAMDANDAPAVLVKAILAALPAPAAGGLTAADVEKAAEIAIRKVLGGLDAPPTT
ncbi:MAG: Phage tail length tape-measure protein [Frankiales bacterium]|nr:Phage tail length tape-measure protein [Frankiales bacterium]